MPSRRNVLLVALLALPMRSYAGAWSHESFENEGALDWVLEFQRKPTPAFVRQALARGVAGGGIDSFDGDSIVAAAEVVAASLGRPCKGLPAALLPMIAPSKKGFAQLAPLADSGVVGVLGPSSELRELWTRQAEALARWESAIRDLRARLSPPPPAPVERTSSGLRHPPPADAQLERQVSRSTMSSRFQS